MELSGVVCGEIGGKRDWKTVVVSCSRCLGIVVFSSDAGDMKSFITSCVISKATCPV